MQAVVAGRLQMEGGDSSGAGRAAKQALEDVMDRQFYECGFELALESEASRVTEATAEGLKDQLHTTRQALEQTRQTLEQTLQALEQTLQTLVEAEAGRSRMELQVPVTPFAAVIPMLSQSANTSETKQMDCHAEHANHDRMHGNALAYHHGRCSDCGRYCNCSGSWMKKRRSRKRYTQRLIKHRRM